MKLQRPSSPENHHATFHWLYENCHVVQGNLEITYLPADADTSFLKVSVVLEMCASPSCCMKRERGNKHLLPVWLPFPFLKSLDGGKWIPRRLKKCIPLSTASQLLMQMVDCIIASPGVASSSEKSDYVIQERKLPRASRALCQEEATLAGRIVIVFERCIGRYSLSHTEPTRTQFPRGDFCNCCPSPHAHTL